MTVDTGVPKISAKRLTLTDDGILTIFFVSSVVTDAFIEAIFIMVAVLLPVE